MKCDIFYFDTTPNVAANGTVEVKFYEVSTTITDSNTLLEIKTAFLDLHPNADIKKITITEIG